MGLGQGDGNRCRRRLAHAQSCSRIAQEIRTATEHTGMTSFNGSLKIAATADVIEAVFAVDESRLVVHNGEGQLGSWPLSELDVERRGDGIHLVLDGEVVVVRVADSDSFIEEIAPRRRRAKHKKTRRQSSDKSAVSKPQSVQAPKAPKASKEPLIKRVARLQELFFKENWARWLADNTVRWSIASFTVIGFALLALFATNTLGMILVLVGMVALIIAALAVSDDLSAYSWIPGELSETALVVAGAVSMAIGGLLIFIG